MPRLRPRRDQVTPSYIVMLRGINVGGHKRTQNGRSSHIVQQARISECADIRPERKHRLSDRKRVSNTSFDTYYRSNPPRLWIPGARHREDLGRNGKSDLRQPFLEGERHRFVQVARDLSPGKSAHGFSKKASNDFDRPGPILSRFSRNLSILS